MTVKRKSKMCGTDFLRCTVNAHKSQYEGEHMSSTGRPRAFSESTALTRSAYVATARDGSSGSATNGSEGGMGGGGGGSEC